MLHVLGHPHARGLVEPGLRVGPAALRVHGNAVGPKTGDIDEKAEPFKNYYVALGFTVLRYIVLLGLYGGMITVIYATFDYMPANGQWRPMAPAVGATVTMTIMFFIVYCGD